MAIGPPRRSIRRGRHGFTLIDAVMAIVIAAVALPALLWAIRDSQRSRVEPVMFTRARWLANEKLEDILADRNSPSRGYAYLTDANYPGEYTVADFPGFSRSVTVTESGIPLTTPGSGAKTVTVSVTYPGPLGAACTFSVSAVLAGYTP